MREYTELTGRNLLRKPLIFGVPLFGLLALAFITLGLTCGLNEIPNGELIALAVGFVGYLILRIASRFAKAGWEESLLWPIERLVRIKTPTGEFELKDSPVEITPPDTLDSLQLVTLKESLLEPLTQLRPSERFTLTCDISDKGAEAFEVRATGKFNLAGKLDLPSLTQGIFWGSEKVYSLYRLPVQTDPLFLFSILKRISTPVTVVVSVQGVRLETVKKQIEVSRRNSARGDTPVSDVDSDITFEESSRILQGISRGDEVIVELSLIFITPGLLELDPDLFCLERNPVLAVCAALGLRKRLHRSHLMRAVNACDLIPNFADPVESGPSILTTLRRKPIYFSPNDPRLEALHWLVVGASGSGKSFFTGLVLKRMLDDKTPMSVLFVDHNRSFRRLVRAFGQVYEEPENLKQVKASMGILVNHLSTPFAMVGIELSDLDPEDKKLGIRAILEQFEAFLRSRSSYHPVYLVLDECWNFMKDEPLLVQRAFREFRKLNGAAIAVTQSLSDFLTDQSGRSIFQNAPIRILLRQGEDLAPYQGVLGLNSVELDKVRTLRQKKGLFSECLIKTPFLTRFGRLYPTDEEHAILRTDNLREEWIAEIRKNHLLARVNQCT